MWILWTILGALGLLIGIILLRALAFTPKNTPYTDTGDPVTFDTDAAVSALQQLVRCKTVSYYDSSLEDDAEFEKLIDLLPSLYPEVYRVCTLERLPDRALLFHWKGKASDAPSVMMAHYDVVPVASQKKSAKRWPNRENKRRTAPWSATRWNRCPSRNARCAASRRRPARRALARPFE